MATVTDNLNTILRLVGGPQYIAGMQAAAGAIQRVANAQAAAARTGQNLQGKIEGMKGAVLELSVIAAALIGIAKPFADAEQAAFRTAATLKNLGSDLPFDELAAFADKMQAMTGIDDDAIISLGALGAQFGLAREEILKTIPVVADLAARSGDDLNEVFETLIRATRGRKQGLIRLGIDPATIKGDITDINNLIKQIAPQVDGMAKLSAKTLKQEFTAAINQATDSLEALGSVLQPLFSTILNGLRRSAEGWSLFLKKVREWMEMHGWAKAPIEKQIGGPSGAAQGLGKAARDSANLEKIAKNTEKAAEAIIRQAFGGPGTVGKAAGNIRALRGALGNASF